MEHNPYSFISTDIIIWNGVICQYGSVCHLMNEGDELQIANDEEVQTYKNKKYDI